MRVGITGAGGLIGRALARGLHDRGWTAVPLPRRPHAEQLETLDAVVHLAGEPIGGRWTEAKKTAIRSSRVDGTRELVRNLAACRTRPRVLVSASGVGYYGDRGDEPLFESSRPGTDFLATVCRDWEREALAAESIGVRTVVLRTGIVLARNGGALEQMARPFAFGAGGPLGSGRQFVPWIAIDDIVGLYLYAIETPALRGPLNAVAPDVATSARFAQAIGAALHRPALAPAPAFALRAVLGEFAGALLASQLVLPAVAWRAGYQWRERRLELALQRIFDPDAKGMPRFVHVLSAQQFVERPREELFAFFSDARNLEAITPPSLRFVIENGAEVLRDGSVINYALRLHGLPLAWKTLIMEWNPPHGFTDVQLRGPYALWEHVHTFDSVAGGTVIGDVVTYALPFGPVGGLAQPFVRRDVAEIFRYRRETIARRLATRSLMAVPS